MRTRHSLGARLVAALAVAVLAATACGSGSGSGGDGRTVIRFLIAPDPLWDFMRDQGIIKKYEAKHNVKIQTNSSWDEFQFFAGGHGDIVSMGTLELPILEKQTKIDTVTFGRYNGFRSTPAAPCDKGYKTLEDIPKGGKVGVNSPLSSTLLWDIYSREKYGFPVQVGNKKTPFKIVVEDHFVLPELLARGDLDAAIIIPEAGARYLRSKKLCYMYGGRASWEVLPELMPNKDHKGVLSNGFTSTKKFYDENPEAIAAFLDLWEEGLKQWAKNKDKIVRTYPQHFSVETEEDIQYVIDYLNSDHDYFQPTVYLDKDWVENEKKIYDLMKQYGLMDKNAEIPEFATVEPPEG